MRAARLGNDGLALLPSGVCMRPARTRSLVLMLGTLAWIAGCGGGGEHRATDAGPDRAADAPAGDGARSDLGGGGSSGADGSSDRGDAAMDAPAKSLGMPCAMAAECASNFCADGVCCNSACTGVCATCAGQGTVGSCVNAQLGTDPRDECPIEAASTCGSTGMCDGTGACDKYPAGTVCKEMGCAVSTLTSAFRCDGAGTCMSIPGQSCAPFNCATDNRCLTICASDADCMAPNSCLNGS